MAQSMGHRVMQEWEALEGSTQVNSRAYGPKPTRTSEAELQALHQGLQLFNDLKLPNVIIEGDALNLIRAFSGPTNLII